MVCDGLGRPLTFFLSPGQMSDAKGAMALPTYFPSGRVLLVDKGYDADRFWVALEGRGDYGLHSSAAQAEELSQA